MKYLIVDDEPLARERLRRLLANLRPDDSCIEAASGEEALRRAKADVPDLVLLDIRMPGMDGLAVAAELATQAQPPAILFCTAYDEYALEALRHAAIGYLLKPVREAELSRALQSAARINRAQIAALQGESGRRELVSSGHSGVQSMAVDSIRCLLAEQKYVTAYSPAGALLLSESLKELELEFPQRFVRVHRNALVALEHVVRLVRSGGGWTVELDGVGERPEISRRHLSTIKSRLASRPDSR